MIHQEFPLVWNNKKYILYPKKKGQTFEFLNFFG